MQEGVEAKEIRFIERGVGGYEDWVFAVFKCKGDCQTIFTQANLQEMMEFTSQITDEEYWPLLCAREYHQDDNQKQFFKDGYGCTESAYLNLTAPAQQFLDQNGANEMSQEQIQQLITAFSPMIMDDNAKRALLGKNFSPENPYSNIIACVFKTIGDDHLFKSQIIQDDQGNWVEKQL